MPRNGYFFITSKTQRSYTQSHTTCPFTLSLNFFFLISKFLTSRFTHDIPKHYAVVQFLFQSIIMNLGCVSVEDKPWNESSPAFGEPGKQFERGSDGDSKVWQSTFCSESLIICLFGCWENGGKDLVMVVGEGRDGRA